MKGYIIREGKFHTDWMILDWIVFKTKKSLKEHFKNTNGFQCQRSKRKCYGEDEEIYENNNKQYGYEIITVELE